MTPVKQLFKIFFGDAALGKKKSAGPRRIIKRWRKRVQRSGWLAIFF